MQIKTNSGIVEGYEDHHLYQFKGIPYAKAKRFMAPQKTKWEGVLDTTRFSKKAPQIEKGKIIPENFSEDCLNLNIYTPSLEKSLPVLVEIHGGAFQNGSNQSMDPYRVIQNDQFVYVTINYRLGILGYLYLEDYPTSGNNGTLDQLAALEWIQENIKFFGGDPKRITLLGSSAGAKAIGALMVNEKAAQLFSQIILISGAYQSVRDQITARMVTKDVMGVLKVKDVNQLVEMDLETLLKGQQAICDSTASTCMFGPVADGRVIPLDFFDCYHQGRYWKGKAIIGSSLNEMGFYPLMDAHFSEHILKISEELFGTNASIAIQEAEALMEEMSMNDAWVKVLSDNMYRTYSYRMARHLSCQGCEIYQYTTKVAPALHCIDHTLAFGSKEKIDRLFTHLKDKKEIYELGKVIRQALINFVMFENPCKDDWKPLSEKQVQLIFDIPIRVEALQWDVCDTIGDAVYIRR